MRLVTALSAFVLFGLVGNVEAAIIDDFSGGLSDWTVQTTRGNAPVANEVIANPNGDPVIKIAAQGGPGSLFANPPWTVLTSNSLGPVGDFDIAVSFAGASGMNGVNSFGLVFGYQDSQNYYMGHVFPGFAGSAFRLEKVVAGAATQSLVAQTAITLSALRGALAMTTRL